MDSYYQTKNFCQDGLCMRPHFFTLFLMLLLLNSCATENFSAIQSELGIANTKAVVFARVTGGQSISWTQYDEFNKPTTRAFQMEAQGKLAAYVIPAGHYVINHIELRPEWQASGGLHKITHKPYYSDFTVEQGDAVYLGDIILGTDGTFYKQNNGGDGSALGLILSAAINAASKSFGDKDVYLNVVDNFAEAQATLKKEVPTFTRPVQKRLLKMGYWAGKNTDE